MQRTTIKSNICSFFSC